MRNFVGARALLPFLVTGAETAAGLKPGSLQPTLDEVTRFEAALDSEFWLGANALSFCSDGVSEFGSNMLALSESILDFDFVRRVGAGLTSTHPRSRNS